MSTTTLTSRIFALYERHRDRLFARCWAPRREPENVTYGDFVLRASAIAHKLQAAGVGDGDVVVVIIKAESTLMSAWLAPHLVGAIPTLFPWPTPKLGREYYEKSIASLLRLCDARIIVTNANLLNTIPCLMTDAPALRGFVLVDDLQIPDAAIVPPRAVLEDPERIAILQHSSGSTGLQKGVALSSRAVLNQLRAHAEAIKLRPTDRYANWMPLYHDGGLCGGFLQPLLNGLPLSILAPMDWVVDPVLLLRAISVDKCTVCWLPNFAYNHMAQRIPDVKLEGLDLSTMRVFVNSGEPVRVASHEAFRKRFGPYGLSPLALTTSYGAAENTLAISQSDPDLPVRVDRVDRLTLSRDGLAVPPKPGQPSLAMMSSGKLLRNVQLRVIDAECKDLPERQVGEYAIQSDCMLSEYYKRPDITAQAMCDGWYLTGDYGYVAEGELYVSGRKKDLIIVGGNNIYPQDLEFIADNVEGVHPGRTVAFGVENEALGTEEVVVIVEADHGQKSESVAERVRLAIAKQSDCVARTVYVVQPTWLIKTSSGKISRTRCKEKFLQETRGSD
ncbi:MAG TPA: AMP-binding protein [Candidatus Tectomicrobia bacterium]|nr:AMP-binding protein [Candidatus Tectomicrobia bacterium]